MRILLVYPENPDTFWGFKRALRFISKKAMEPPLGLLTVAAMLPASWELRLVDLNVRRLHDRDLTWADYVFLSGMIVQRASFEQVLARCARLGVKVVAGGPMATTTPEDFPTADHLVLNEAEVTLPLFLADLERGSPQRIYRADGFPEITSTPQPRWDLLELKKYATMDVQYSRGCPHDCEFCNITTLYGHRPRTKSTAQFLAELDSLHAAGWRDSVFVVDDNFIGNRRKLRTDLLPALVEWSERNGHPFEFSTEATIELSDDEELMELMVRAGFRMVFVGIETPDEGSLAECNKVQNRGRDLVESVKILQRHGLEVTGGFIVGFDSDRPDIFDRQIRFIQNSGIMTAMVGVLQAPLGTRLFQRLKDENRLLDSWTGNNMDAEFPPAHEPGGAGGGVPAHPAHHLLGDRLPGAGDGLPAGVPPAQRRPQPGHLDRHPRGAAGRLAAGRAGPGEGAVLEAARPRAAPLPAAGAAGGHDGHPGLPPPAGLHATVSPCGRLKLPGVRAGGPNSTAATPLRVRVTRSGAPPRRGTRPPAGAGRAGGPGTAPGAR